MLIVMFFVLECFSFHSLKILFKIMMLSTLRATILGAASGRICRFPDVIIENQKNKMFFEHNFFIRSGNEKRLVDSETTRKELQVGFALDFCGFRFVSVKSF